MTNVQPRIIRRAALCALVFILALVAPALAAPDGTTVYRALLIGNSSYTQLEDLTSCAYDLSAMKSALTSGTVSYKTVSTKSNLKASGIATAVNDMLAWGADEDDVTVFYYSGHGAKSGLAGVDYNTTTGSGVYSFSLLQSALSQVPGKVIVLLDSCQSGGLIGKSASGADGFTDNAIAAFSGSSSSGLSSKAITSGDKFHVIASSSQSQSSYAMDDKYGLTTWALCEAMGWSHNGSKAGNKLTSLEGDLNGDLTVTIGEAYSYASTTVSELLAKYKLSQDMQVYPSGSTQKLIGRAVPGSSTTETSKALSASTMNFSKVCIAPGMKLQLQLNVAATNVSWSSSKNAIATVDSTGLVTGVKYSYSVVPTIMVTYRKDGKSYYTTCEVRVLPARYVVQTIEFKYTEKTLEKGSSYTMPVKFTPASARYKSLRWTSSDPKVATVTSGGKITAVAESGTAVITATATSGVTESVTVTAAIAVPRSVRLSDTKLTLLKGKYAILAETVLPTTAKDRNVTWDSSNEAVATVNEDGKVTAVSTGRATITCTTVTGGKTATCSVSVVSNQSIPRTKPKSTAGRLVASAKKIYYNESGMLCVDMWFYNRTGHTQTAPQTASQVLILKLRSGTKRTAVINNIVQQPVSNGKYILMTLKANPSTYTQFRNLDLRGSDAWCEAVN